MKYLLLLYGDPAAEARLGYAKVARGGRKASVLDRLNEEVQVVEVTHRSPHGTLRLARAL